MHPAYSVILFTVASGAGYGLFIWLAIIGLFAPALITGGVLSPILMVSLSIVSLGLVTLGLFSSLTHLGHPERAWRAISQWRSSWLSREGLFALLFYGPALLFTYGCWQAETHSQLMQISALLSIVLGLVTLACTGMIYASLRTIAAWYHPMTMPNYVILGLASGFMLMVSAALIGGAELSSGWAGQALGLGLILVVLTASVKMIWWRALDGSDHGFTRGEALGLGKNKQVREMEPAHNSPNFVMREMGYQIGRKHAQKLRNISLILMGVIPALVIIALLSGLIANGGMLVFSLGIATASMLVGLLVERWLFFAEAVHLVTLYYGAGGTSQAKAKA